MNGLTEFVLARIAEDEAVAQEPVMFDSDGWARLADRVLAECEAKEEIVKEWARVERLGTNGFGPGVLRHLASVYADHPDYREEWRP